MQVLEGTANCCSFDKPWMDRDVKSSEAEWSDASRPQLERQLLEKGFMALGTYSPDTPKNTQEVWDMTARCWIQGLVKLLKDPKLALPGQVKPCQPCPPVCRGSGRHLKEDLAS